MKNSKKWILFLLCAVLLVPTMTAAAADGLYIFKDGKNVTGDTFTLDVNSTDTLAFVVSTDDTSEKAPADPVKWTSNNTDVVTVTDGTVSLAGNDETGTVNICVQYDNGQTLPKAVVRVFVGNLVTKVALFGSSHEVDAGKTLSISSTVTPTEATKQDLKWYVGTADSVKPNETGFTASEYAAISDGTLRAKSVDGDKDVYVYACAVDNSEKICSDSYKVTIHPVAEKLILKSNGNDVTNQTIGLMYGNSTGISITAVIEPSAVTQGPFKWTTSASNIAYISGGDETDNKTVTIMPGTKKGVATITVMTTDGSKKVAQLKINVSTLVEDISITCSDTFVTTKKSVSCRVKGITSGADNKTVKWKIDDSSKAVITSDGKVTGRTVYADQTVEVWAEAADGSGVISNKVSLTVRPLASRVNIYDDSSNLINNATVGVEIGDDFEVEAEILLGESTMTPDVTWKSSKPKVAAIVDNKDGKAIITGLKAGKSVITATAKDGSGKYAQFTVNVARLVNKIVIDGSSVVGSGKSITLKAYLDPSNATSKKLLWESSNPGAASVSSKGVVKGGNVTKDMKVTITAYATDGGPASKSSCKNNPSECGAASFVVTVYPCVTGVSIWTDKNVTGKMINYDLDTGGTISLTALTTPANASKDVAWKSSKPGIAKVDSAGNVTGLSVGKAVITATAKDGSKKSGKVTVYVTHAVKSITINGPDEVRAGKEITLKAVVGPSNATNKSVSWSITAGAAAAKINSKGVLTGKSVTADTIVTVRATAKDGSGFYTEKTITVHPAASRVLIKDEADQDITGTTLVMVEGSTVDLTAEVKVDDAKQDVKWTSSAKTVASVADGTVTAIKKGTATITATATDGTGKKGIVKIKVVKEAKAASLKILGDATQALAGETVQLYPKISPIGASEADIKWSITGPATVDTDGLVTVNSDASEGAIITVTAEVDDGSGVKSTYKIQVVINKNMSLGEEEIPVEEESLTEESVELIAEEAPELTEEVTEAPETQEEVIATPEENPAAESAELPEEVTEEPEIEVIPTITIAGDQLGITAGEEANFDWNRVDAGDLGIDSLKISIADGNIAELDPEQSVESIFENGLRIRALAAGETKLVIAYADDETVSAEISIFVTAPVVEELPVEEAEPVAEAPVEEAPISEADAEEIGVAADEDFEEIFPEEIDEIIEEPEEISEEY